ncbi:uncharacterized protein LOC131329558 [Rhododendron vialii]|uniref:uncharacterized protein LOC131329558 n=1 Tax=Rhododendron vialii TaxID=182163 RepID=UPI00265F0978|nr:uncharacterized protein LOC131329558 [Rhododendron vialii]
MSPVGTLAKLMEWIEQHAKNEEDILWEDGKVVAEQAKGPAKKADKPEPKTYRERKDYGLRKSQGDKDAKRATSQHCNYHKDRGHMTEDCEMFKQHLDDLVSRGYLKEFIQEEPKGVEKAMELDYEQNPRGVIHMINGLAAFYTRNEVRLLQRQVKHDQHVMQLGKKKGREEEVCNEGIVFTDEDLGGVKVPYNDALVIILRIGEYDMERILVDSGSCTEVQYYDAFKKLGLTQADLVQSITPLVGFRAGVVWPLGKVTLPVWEGTVVLQTDFLVVDVPSSYNAIIGRTWLHKMRSVFSTYHQMVKFPGSNGIEKIRGNQKVSEQCLISIIKNAPKAMLVQAIEVLDQPTIEDVRGNPAEKVVEGLKKI